MIGDHYCYCIKKAICVYRKKVLKYYVFLNKSEIMLYCLFKILLLCPFFYKPLKSIFRRKLYFFSANYSLFF